jgi:toxin ParE1/3/4
VKYRFTAQARADLRDIAVYTRRKWGDEQCRRYLEVLRGACRRLIEQPELRRQCPDVPPYCRALVGKHALFYRLEADGSVLVVRVLHAAMLPELHLPPANELP